MNELELNPGYHDPAERAELFSAGDRSSTENEYLALLVALAVLPSVCAGVAAGCRGLDGG